MVADDDFGRGAGGAGAVDDARGVSGQDRAGQNHHELVGNGGRVRGAGELCLTLDGVGDVLAVDEGDFVDGIGRGGVLGGGLQEHAAFEGGVGEPIFEEVEEGEDAGARVGPAASFHDAEPLGEFDAVAFFEDGDDEVVFAFEVVIEGGFGDADDIEDLIEPDGVKTVLVEERVGRGDEFVAGFFLHVWDQVRVATCFARTGLLAVKVKCTASQATSWGESVSYLSQQRGRRKGIEMVANGVFGNEGGERRVFVFEGVSAAIGIAQECPGVRVDAFERTWREVDRGREVVEARGLESRVHVWHVSAADVARRVIGERSNGR